MPKDAKSTNLVLDIKRLCIQGKIDRAVRLCKRSDIDLETLSKVFQDTMQMMFQKKRVNELLSFLFKYEELSYLCPYTVNEILQKIYDQCDYSGFLKQAYRFQSSSNFESQIDNSIASLLDSGQVESASAYRLKFDRLSGKMEGDSQTNHNRGSDESCQLCDNALNALRRIDRGATRIKGKHCCEFIVDGRVSATAYHNAGGLKIYIHCAPDKTERLLEMAEYGQVRAIHRKDPEAIKKKQRPIVANAYCKVDVELIMPLAAFAQSNQPSLGSDARNTKNGLSPRNRHGGRQNDEVHMEGARQQKVSTQIERNPRARAVCIAKYGTQCTVCEIDFEAVYGILGRGFVHVHHLMPLATTSNERQIDPIRDMRPVCPNCHAMLHRRIPPYSISELRRIREMALQTPEEPKSV